jgi:HSP20 family protein
MEGVTMLIHRLPALPGWSAPLRELDDVRREMERLFDSLAGTGAMRGPGVFPALNLSETPEALVVRAELPGMRPENFEVTVEDNTLTLAGERGPFAEEEGVSYHRREREWGMFRRSFGLPVRVDAGSANARYRDGILTIELPKAPEARPRQITVKAGA